MPITKEAVEQAKAMIERCHAAEAKAAPQFMAHLRALKLPTLKALARDAKANTRGCRVRADYERAIVKVWRAEVWDAAGYRYGGHRHLSRFFTGS